MLSGQYVKVPVNYHACMTMEEYHIYVYGTYLKKIKELVFKGKELLKY